MKLQSLILSMDVKCLEREREREQLCEFELEDFLLIRDVFQNVWWKLNAELLYVDHINKVVLQLLFSRFHYPNLNRRKFQA